MESLTNGGIMEQGVSLLGKGSSLELTSWCAAIVGHGTTVTINNCGYRAITNRMIGRTHN